MSNPIPVFKPEVPLPQLLVESQREKAARGDFVYPPIQFESRRSAMPYGVREYRRTER